MVAGRACWLYSFHPHPAFQLQYGLQALHDMLGLRYWYTLLVIIVRKNAFFDDYGTCKGTNTAPCLWMTWLYGLTENLKN